MTAKILDGNALSAKLRESLRHRAAELSAQGCQPGLAVILVGENPASQVYVRNKIKACEAVGVHSEKYEFPADTPPEKVLNKIAALNADPKIHGILVQLPLPAQFDHVRAAAFEGEREIRRAVRRGIARREIRHQRRAAFAAALLKPVEKP